jgi:hypothetical protein
MSDPRILDKIKALLRLSASPNQFEAELAMERAFILAQRHNIDLDSVELDEQTSTIVHERVRHGFRITMDRRLALIVAELFFNVKGLISRPDFVLVGIASDIEIARYVIDFLVQAHRRSLAGYVREIERAGRRVTSTKRQHFTSGFFYGIIGSLQKHQDLLRLESPRYAIALRSATERRDEYASAQFTIRKDGYCALRMPAAVTPAMMAGYRSGSETKIAQPIVAPPAQLQLGTG